MTTLDVFDEKHRPPVRGEGVDEVRGGEGAGDRAEHLGLPHVERERAFRGLLHRLDEQPSSVGEGQP